MRKIRNFKKNKENFEKIKGSYLTLEMKIVHIQKELYH